jgi:proline-specific peptidase
MPIPGLSKPCQAWYTVVGDLTSSETPLIVIHGDPGACHEYSLPLMDLNTSTPLVFYDQIGNGQSTHLPEKNGYKAFWSVDLFQNKPDNLIVHLRLKHCSIDVFGHSWGEMLPTVWAATPSSSANLRRLVIASSLASMAAWRIGISSLVRKLPVDVQEIIRRSSEKKEFDSPEYEAALEYFYKKHLSLARPWPSIEVEAALGWFAKDATNYNTM